MKIANIIGARPQFIKAATVSRAIADHNHRTPNSLPLEEVIIHTGQHYDDEMSAIFFRELEIPKPKYNLNIGSGSHGWQTAQMLMGIEKVLLKENPDVVLIYGDTNSTLAGALAAAKLHIRLAHVEAGLRSFNRLMPEEINRVIADHVSTLLLCPSQVAVNNLTREGITKGVCITGDVMFDALQFAAIKSSADSDILSRLALSRQDYLLATVHRAENTDNGQRFKDILTAFESLGEIVVLPAHPRTRKLLQDTGYKPPEKIKLIEPLGYFDLIALEKSARMILTDSGGIQKEAYWLKVPCITLRDETEWIETVAAGWNVLTGADQEKIIESVHSCKRPSEHPPLYGDGRAAERIVKIINDRLEAVGKGSEP